MATEVKIQIETSCNNISKKDTFIKNSSNSKLAMEKSNKSIHDENKMSGMNNEITMKLEHSDSLLASNQEEIRNSKSRIVASSNRKTDSPFIRKNNTFMNTEASNQKASRVIDTLENNSKHNFGKASPMRPRKNSKINEDSTLYYDFYTEPFKFKQEDLEKNEPVPEFSWMHKSCVLWISELTFKGCINDIDNRIISTIDKMRFKTECMICHSCSGAAVKCSFEMCKESFHTECARRAKLYIENQSYSSAKFVIFCPKHTPLLFKNTLYSEEKKAKEDINKFYRFFKRFLKTRKIQTDEIKIKNNVSDQDFSCIDQDEEIKSITSNNRPFKKTKAIKPVKLEKPKREHLLKTLSYDKKQIFYFLKKENQSNTEFTFHVNIKRQEEEDTYEVSSINIPQKSIFTHKVPKTLPVWNNVSNELKITNKCAHTRFLKAFDELKFLEKNSAPQQLDQKKVSDSNTLATIKSSQRLQSELDFSDNDDGIIIRAR